MLKVIFRTLIMYIFVSIGVRLMGKRQIGDMQPTELVVTLLISEIAAIPLQDVSQPVSVGLTAIFVLVFLEIIASVAVMKNLHLRRIFSGKAVVIIKNGKINNFIASQFTSRMNIFSRAYQINFIVCKSFTKSIDTIIIILYLLHFFVTKIFI